jgi:NAD+ kinase
MTDRPGQRVGVVDGGGGDGQSVREAIADAGADLATGAARDVLAADPRVVVAVGEGSFIRVATAAPDVPILPVAAGRGVRSVPASATDGATPHLLQGEWRTERHPVLGVDVDGEDRGRAVMDVATMTAEAAHISEYQLTAGDAALGRVRADGVVVATPAGSAGYARRIGAPVLAPGTGVVVAPVAPFTTAPDHWVIDLESLAIRQARADADVELGVDDTVVGTLDPTEIVSCRVVGHVSTIVLPESRSRYR